MFIEYRPVRVKCPHCEASPVEEVPWADPYQRETRRLQQHVALEASSMPTLRVAAHYGLSWSTVRRAEEAAMARWEATRPEVRLHQVGVDEKYLGRRNAREEKFVTIRSLIWMPCCASSSADSAIVLLHVQRSRDSGSPRVSGLTSISSAGHTSGYRISNGRLPALRRTLTTSSGRAPAPASSRPLRTVLIAIPVARATIATPPYPIAPASVSAQSRRARSSMVAFSRRHFSRTDLASFTAEIDHAGQILSIPPRPISTLDSIDSPFREP